MSDKRMLVFGASGHAKVVIDIARDQGYELVAVLDDNPALVGSLLSGVPVVGGGGLLAELKAAGIGQAVIAIGANAVRRKLAPQLQALGFSFPVLVHSRAWVAPSVNVGEGTVVMPGAMINAEAKVGRHVIINTGASLDHECEIGDFVHIAPGVHLCGAVQVGSEALLGVGTAVIPCQSIGARCVVGAGSVIISDWPDDARVAGVPAVSIEKAV